MSLSAAAAVAADATGQVGGILCIIHFVHTGMGAFGVEYETEVIDVVKTCESMGWDGIYWLVGAGIPVFIELFTWDPER